MPVRDTHTQTHRQTRLKIMALQVCNWANMTMAYTALAWCHVVKIASISAISLFKGVTAIITISCMFVFVCSICKSYKVKFLLWSTRHYWTCITVAEFTQHTTNDIDSIEKINNYKKHTPQYLHINTTHCLSALC